MQSHEPVRRALVLGVTDVDYPRHERLARHLEGSGYAVDVVLRPKVVPGPHVLSPVVRTFVLLRRALQRRTRYDVVVLPAFALEYSVLTWALARGMRAVHVVDGFVGLYETTVEDNGLAGSGSILARILAVLDRVAYRSADVYLVDTDLRAGELEARFGRGPAVVNLPVGAPDWVRTSRRASSSHEPLAILYYGNYIPLHAVDYLIESAAAVADEVPVHLTMVGSGSTRSAAERMVTDLQLEEVCTFLDPVPAPELMRLIDAHDVVAGIFGSSPKAQSVIANKVWQGLAAGAQVVTRRSAALDEIRDVAKGLLLEVDASDPSDLTRLLVELAVQKRSGRLAAISPDCGARLAAYVDARYEALDEALAERTGALATTTNG